MRVVAYAPDLMDQSKLRGHGAEMVRSLDELADTEADLVLLDLARPGAVEAVGHIDAPVIGFGSHVDTELLEAARRAGGVEVLPRSQFFRRLPDLLSGL